MIHSLKKSLGLPYGKCILGQGGMMASCHSAEKCIRNERSREVQNTFLVVPKGLLMDWILESGESY